MNLKRTNIDLRPDPSRVLLRPFNMPHETMDLVGRSYDMTSSERIARIVERTMAFSESEVGTLLDQVEAEFSTRHRNLEILLEERYKQVVSLLPTLGKLSRERSLLIGSYFLSEYSIESAALFNPSIVPHPDQSKLPAGSLRFVLSVRAVGEGHISSITFREGVITADQHISVTPAGRYTAEPRHLRHVKYDKEIFGRKLTALGLRGSFVEAVLNGLSNPFEIDELERSITEILHPGGRSEGGKTVQQTARDLSMLAISNSEVEFLSKGSLDERVLFPMTPPQKNGIEDARFVLFRDNDKTTSYYATYTAYDGKDIHPQLLQTFDFAKFRFITLHGSAVQNKGMALFPRKIKGRYAMLGRQDGENITLMVSDSIHFWDNATVILRPAFPWESVQLGNCGSPMETDSGWLVLSHGVGPMRKYCIGGFLLDRENPGKVIGRLREPLLHADENEREGYVPNVVYSCGSLLHNGELIIPYGASDCMTSFARIPLDEVLGAMR